VSSVPCVIKPGEIVLVNVNYHSKDFEENDLGTVSFHIYSAQGKGYKLPHIITRDVGIDHQHIFFEFYQLSSKKQSDFEKLGGCLSHPSLLSTRLPSQST
jgi:hypothetical protein